ncbi:MAG: hypothetical protein ACXABY_08950 [Candidatus Thorarchaeota archaeon]|jgi:hypothetical protein
MKFSFFKQLKNFGKTPSLKEVVEYVAIDLGKVLKDLDIGLQRLSFVDNFDGFTVEVTIATGAELKIRNELRDRVPTQRLIVRGGTDSQNIVDGDTPWDLNFVYLKNLGAGTATATVLFTR